MCPRYNKVLLYTVTARESLEPAAEIALQGRPVAMAAAGDVLVILQRPPGDDKHLGPGWWEAVSLDGKRRGPRVPAGLLSRRPGRHARRPLPAGPQLRAGRGRREEAPSRPRRLSTASMTWKRSRLVRSATSSLEPKDDADRLILSASGTRGLITLPKARQAVAIDLTRPEDPRVAGRLELAEADAPYVSRSPDGDWIVMPTVAGTRGRVAPASTALRARRDEPVPPVGYLVYTLPERVGPRAGPVRPLGSRSAGSRSRAPSISAAPAPAAWPSAPSAASSPSPPSRAPST